MQPTRRTFLLTGSAAALAEVRAAQAAVQAPARAAKWLPKLSENLADVNPDTLRWLKQLGCQHVIFQGTDGVDRGKKGFWAGDDIRPIKNACTAAGLILESMMIPIDFTGRHGLGR